VKVFLVGMMGSGKSTIGKLLSNILGYRFIDMDEEIEKSEGRRIRDIFKRRGEKYFRKLEKKLLKEISRRRENLIVATGGGVIKDQENREILKEHKTIFLMVEPGELLKRVKVDDRPLLSEGKNRIFDIWKQRERYYKLFTTVESTGLNVWETCAKVLYKVLERERLSIMDSVHKVLIERKALEDIKGDVVFTTCSVQKIYGEFLGNSYIFPDGESVKDMKYVLEAYKILCDIGFSRSQVVTGVGGGALTDFTGFVASTFKRGTKLFLYPTTLLAQVDASIGGKNSVNFEGVKNLLGTFKMPDLVVIDPLAPLSMGDKRFKEGIIEAFKMSLISGKGLNCFNNELLMRRLTSVEKIIEFSVKEKLRIVEEDPHDRGIRNVLNFGHTIGHVYESITKVPHGVAVGWGMIKETEFFMKRKMSDRIVLKLLEDFLAKLDIGSLPSLDRQRVHKFLRNDKKFQSGRVRMPVIRAPGNYDFVEVEIEELMEVI